jgi:competence protein ComEC
VRSVGLLPALAFIAGAACASSAPPGVARTLIWLLPVALMVSVAGWHRGSLRLTTAALAFGFWSCGLLLASNATERAVHSTLRAALDRKIGGFAIDGPGPEHDHDPIPLRAVLIEDASPRDGFVSLRVQAVAVRLRGVWHSATGGVVISVGGSAAADRLLSWRAGRTIAAPVAFRRPVRFLNDGVPDFERDLALDGTTLLGSVKSALLVDVVGRGGPVDELAADVRAHVRRAIARWVAPHDAVSAAIAAAVLIGDRTGLPDETRDALQAAGTYHVIAISGGNIAIVAASAFGLLALCGVRGRAASIVVVLVLVAYAMVVTAGPSVWRATLMAIAYFVARALDHRTPVWQATSLAAVAILIVHPLDISDPGFMLTFGATAALVEGGRRGAALLPRSRVGSWAMASLIGSIAVEAALLPVSASAFSRVTSAGLILNLLAVPAMAIMQMAAMIVTLADSLSTLAGAAGWVAHVAAVTLVSSASLVREAPWLAARVPAPGAALVIVYYAAMAVMIAGRGRFRASGAIVFAATVLLMATGIDLTRVTRPAASRALRLTVFDVGQGESMLLETPARAAILVDTGGAPFGGSLDIGQRVLAPALWARGVRSLDAVLVTHGDPDHLGGAAAVLEDFSPHRLWEGIRVPVHPPTLAILDDAARRGVQIESLRAGRGLPLDGVRVRVLHPPEPDWERRRVRNDDSVVLEVVHGEVALLLTGDISAEVERAIVPLLTPARIRVLKVAHHGSRTSSSAALLDAWRPQLAVISCGRGNRFGHPATEVLQRLDAIGATVFRTDLHGQITVESDGQSIFVTTFRRTSNE